MKMESNITISRPNYRRLKMSYDKAVKEGKTDFTFDGDTLLVQYAKYVLEYMEMELKRLGE